MGSFGKIYPQRRRPRGPNQPARKSEDVKQSEDVTLNVAAPNPKPALNESAPKWDYQVMLQDPRWKDVRRRIIARDKGRCRMCGTRPLICEVHHGFYQYGTEPWRYEESSLSTLCRECHEKETVYADGQKTALIKAMASRGVLGLSYQGLAKAFWRGTLHASAAEVCAALAWSVYDKRSQKAMLRRYRRDLHRSSRRTLWRLFRFR